MPKIGLEIHQRLDTGKLFCRCKYGEHKDKKIKRKLNVVSSEVFEKDRAALFEEKKGKTYIYEFGNDVCLVELDEEPIHEVNKEALVVALAIAKKMGMLVFSKTQVMRKIVIDGSNTSGFQRTMLLGVEGKIKGVGIETICLEEESAGIVERDKDKAVYDLNRLGIPLVEIATSPEIKDGKQAKEIAEAIGMLLRMSGKAMRGIGTIRQDLNVSVEGGSRVEIKGAQELDMIEKWVNNEIKRQRELIKVIEELRKRKAYENIKEEFYDVGKAIVSGFPKKAIERGEKVIAVKLPKHKGILGKELTPGKRYGTELSYYAKQAGVKGIIHSDEDLEKYGINREKVEEILGIEEEDGFAIVVAKEETAKKALSYVVERAKMDYVPKEVRKTLKDGNTEFMRPLPGKARMYPETDVEIINLGKYIKEAEKFEILGFEEMVEKLEKEVGNKEIAKKLARSKMLGLYKKYAGEEKGFFAYFLTDVVESKKKSVGKEDVEAILYIYEEGGDNKESCFLFV